MGVGGEEFGADGNAVFGEVGERQAGAGCDLREWSANCRLA
jgi:hypothetical protein